MAHALLRAVSPLLATCPSSKNGLQELRSAGPFGTCVLSPPRRDARSNREQPEPATAPQWGRSPGLPSFRAVGEAGYQPPTPELMPARSARAGHAHPTRISHGRTTAGAVVRGSGAGPKEPAARQPVPLPRPTAPGDTKPSRQPKKYFSPASNNLPIPHPRSVARPAVSYEWATCPERKSGTATDFHLSNCVAFNAGGVRKSAGCPLFSRKLR